MHGTDRASPERSSIATLYFAEGTVEVADGTDQMTSGSTVRYAKSALHPLVAPAARFRPEDHPREAGHTRTGEQPGSLRDVGARRDIGRIEICHGDTPDGASPGVGRAERPDRRMSRRPHAQRRSDSGGPKRSAGCGRLRHAYRRASPSAPGKSTRLRYLTRGPRRRAEGVRRPFCPILLQKKEGPQPLRVQ
jgi:hypothetical protein